MIESSLLEKIKRYCLSFDISPTKFGLKSLNDPNLIADLEAGRELRRDTRLRVEKYLEKLSRKSGRSS